jgi:16S rRNA (uracil1498-N3)-methyltransferase
VHVFYVPDLSRHELSEEEALHATRVLRLRRGDRVALSNGTGAWCLADLTDVQSKRCPFTIVAQTEIPPPHHHIHLAVAATKNHDRLEWLVEKATEIGIQEITFLRTEKTERKHIQLERLTKVAIAAMKQSQQSWLPRLNPLQTLSELLPLADVTRFIAYVDFANPVSLSKLAARHQRYLVLIGPEGDFTEAELQFALQHGFQKVSLGPHRLRTETAALVACMMLNEINS